MRIAKVVCMLFVVAGLLIGCQPLAERGAAPQPAGEPASVPTTLVVAAHDSFSVSEEVVAEFEQINNATVQFLTLGDAGEALNKIILSKDAPLADIFFGVDNSFLSRALAADVFVPYVSPLLDALPADLRLDAENRLLPVDTGYVTLNADAGWFEERGLPLPESLEDLTQPAYAGLLVAPNPATSSPGLAFLLATIAHFGEQGAFDFWAALKDNDVLITDGWSTAYFEHFTVGSGGNGDRPLVVSYTTSPPADVLYATDGRSEPASVNLNLPGGVFRQIEFAGVLKGAQQPELAQRWLDFMLDRRFQNDISLQMFVYPANPAATLPELFERFAAQPDNAMSIDATDIDANRERWISAWTDLMAR